MKAIDLAWHFLIGVSATPGDPRAADTFQNWVQSRN